MPRVLFFSPGASLHGGSQRSLAELLEALAADGQLELVLAVRARPGLGERAAVAGIRVVVVPSSTWLSSAFRGGSVATTLRRARYTFRILVGAIALARVLRRLQPDVVVSNTLDSPVAAIAARLARLPHVWWIREFGLRDSGKRFLLGERATFAVVDRTSRHVVCVSDAVAGYVGHFVDRRKISVIRPAIALERGPEVTPPTPSEPLRLLLLGRVMVSKGHDVLVEALPLVRDAGVAVRVRIVGDPEEEFRAQLESRCRSLDLGDAVEFVAWADATTEIDRAHAVLMCSASEAFGRVTAEALERGRPVIGTRSAGTVELVHDGVNGLLFTPGSPRSLADAIVRVVREPGLLDLLAQGARRVGAGTGSVADAVDATVAVVDGAARATSSASSSSSSSCWSRGWPAWRRR